MNNKLFPIYFLQSVNGFAWGLIGIFIPIYLLDLGFRLDQVFIYFIFLYSSTLVFTFVAGYFSKKFGLQTTLILWLPIVLVYLGLLATINKFGYIYLTAVFGGMQTAFYWLPLNAFFSRNATQKQMGSHVSNLFMLPSIVSLFSPLIGAIIIKNYSYSILMLLIMFLNIISIAPILFRKKVVATFNFDVKKIKKIFFKNPKYLIGEIIENIGEETEGVLWPIFIYLILGDLLDIGYIGTIIAISSIIFTYAVGKLTDKVDNKKLIRIGALLLISTWGIRMFIDTRLLIYMLTVLGSFFALALNLPFTVLGYKLSKENNYEEFIIFREIPVALGRIIVFSLAIIFVKNFNFSFLIAIFSHIYFLFF